MARHFFAFSADNFSAKAVTARWIARAVDLAEVKADPVLGRLKAKPLEVTDLGIVRHRCDNPMDTEPPVPHEKVELVIESGGRLGLGVVVHTRQRYKKGLQMALIAVEEERDDGLKGGILVAVTSDGGTFVVPTQNLAPRPVPLTLIDGPCLQAGEAYVKTPAPKVVRRDAGASMLGLLMRNTGASTLRSVVFYLESVGLPGVRWDSRVFDMDVLEPGEEFFAAFPFDPSNAEEGSGTVRLVGYSDGFDRTRLDVELTIVDPRNW